MGLMDFITGRKASSGAAKPKSERELHRLERLVSNKLSQNYDRQEALEQLCSIGTARSARILLKRFNWQMDPSITDQEEKELAVDGITAAGESALDPIRDYCKRAESLTWPLKALRRIVPAERLEEEVLALLDLFDTEYVRNPEPKVQLLGVLDGYRSEDVRIAVEPFLADMSEPVRFAATNALFSVGRSESIPALIAVFEDEESLRVKNRVASGLCDKAWPIPEELAEVCANALPDGFSLDDERRVSNHRR